MRKLTLAILACTIAVFSYAQDFMNVPVEGTKAEVIRKMNEKGFTVTGSNSDPVYLTMKGKVGADEVEFNAVFTPVSKVCWKFVVYLPKETQWYYLKSSYNKTLEMLSEKYGKPDKTYAFFISPYEENDGYEMTAVAVEKARFFSFWDATDTKNIALTASISKFKQVAISYENTINSAKNSEERKSQNKNAF